MWLKIIPIIAQEKYFDIDQVLQHVFLLAWLTICCPLWVKKVEEGDRKVGEQA